MLHPDEAHARQSVIVRLLERFPTATPARVGAAVDASFSRYGAARVRDFVEVLVEAEVARELAAADPAAAHQAVSHHYLDLPSETA